MGGYGSTRWSGHARRRTLGEGTHVVSARDAADALEDARAEGDAGVPTGPGVAAVDLGWPVNAPVMAEATAQPAGGLRWWLHCPRCGVRRATLYTVPDARRGLRLGCRGCLRLAYPSQRLGPLAQCEHRQRQLVRRLGGRPVDSLPDFPDKPPRMWWRTYHRVADTFTAVEARRFGMSVAELEAWAARLGARRG